MDEQIGRYRLIKELGEGAMARVYLAELETGIGFKRKVALKVVRPEFARDPKFLALMGREAMIGSMLQHPNIVQTLEFNEADGRSFLALEFVEGETLGELLERAGAGGAFPLMAGLEVMVQVLKGLSYAHNLRSPEGEAMEIVHRDLKPGNIMLSQHGLVKVMDFGIAKAKIATANITTAGQVRGTPIYMAPEQVTGRPLDGRSDQFAAGTVLYELLTGKQLFIDNNLIRIMQRVARAEVDEQLAELSALNPGLGPILRQMWARDPDDRFSDCEEPARLIEDIVYELKSAEQEARRPPPSSGVAHAPGQSLPEPTERQVPGGFFSAIGDFMLRLFGSSPPKASPKKKARRRRKKVAATVKAGPVERRPSEPVERRPNLAPENESLGSMEVVFEDATSSNFEAPASAPPAPKPAPVIESAEAPPSRKVVLGPDTASLATDSVDESMSADWSSERLDPFFTDNFDE